MSPDDVLLLQGDDFLPGNLPEAPIGANALAANIAETSDVPTPSSGSSTTLLSVAASTAPAASCDCSVATTPLEEVAPIASQVVASAVVMGSPIALDERLSAEASPAGGGTSAAAAPPATVDANLVIDSLEGASATAIPDEAG